MEGLAGLVGREGHQILCGMPGGIYGTAEDGTVLHLHLVCLSVLHDDGSAVVGTHVEEHILCTLVAVVVAVDAVVMLLVIAAVVLIHCALSPVGEVALVDAQLAVKLISGLDETVAQIGVDVFLCHCERVRLVLHPAVGVLHIYCHADVFPPVGLEQCPPGGSVYAHAHVLVGLGQHFLAVGSLQLCHCGSCSRVLHHEVERSYVGRDDYIAVVGKDVGLRVECGGLGGQLCLVCAGSSEGQHEQQAGAYYIMCVLSCHNVSVYTRFLL